MNLFLVFVTSGNYESLPKVKTEMFIAPYNWKSKRVCNRLQTPKGKGIMFTYACVITQ